MRTAKEFKAAGLVFVEGDTSDPISDIMTGFAWRDNTSGERPSFVGWLEVEFKNGPTAVWCSSYFSDAAFDLSMPNPILRWRPALVLPSVEPQRGKYVGLVAAHRFPRLSPKVVEACRDVIVHGVTAYAAEDKHGCKRGTVARYVNRITAELSYCEAVTAAMRGAI